MEIQLKICRFRGSLSQKGFRPLNYSKNSYACKFESSQKNESRQIPQNLAARLKFVCRVSNN